MAASDLSKRIARRLRDPVSFITEVLRDPETGQPFALYPAQAEFLRRAFTLSPDGRWRYPELIFSEARRRRALENLLAKANARSAIRMWRLPNSVASADYDRAPSTASSRRSATAAKISTASIHHLGQLHGPAPAAPPEPLNSETRFCTKVLGRGNAERCVRVCERPSFPSTPRA
jgi:hypothetical protein